MKKILFFGAALMALTACSFNKELETTKNPGANAQIGFSVAQKNMTKASLQDANHYNFGVFAYKSTDQVNWVMDNYLVGYYDDAKAYQKTGSTVEDKPGVVDGKSYWMYEGMGKNEYNGTYAGGPLTRFYQSNKDNQYLKYWDLSAPTTTFYAYAPYVGTDGESGNLQPVTYVDGVAQTATGSDTYTLNIPDGTLKAGMNKPEEHEFMYAATKVDKANYGHDVSLNFKRLVAKVNIKFWEDVPGYKVRIINLTSDYGISAVPSIKNANFPNSNEGYGEYGYKAGKYYTSNGAKINFTDANLSSITVRQYQGKTASKENPLNFAVPTASAIGENRHAAVASDDTYYAIPKGGSSYVTPATTDEDLANTGFTFHVSYELTAEDSGEHIIVRDATVHVPANYCKWEMNKHYTYIFRITKGSNGTTDSTPSIDPTDPEVPTVQALYPIIFDNCTVTDWDEVVSEWDITDGTQLSYHNVTLSDYSVNNSTQQTITVTIADGDTHSSHGVDYSAVTITGPNGSTTSPTGITYSGPTTDSEGNTIGKITVGTDAAAGLYTVTYTCPEPTATSANDINKNHPKTWTNTFFVGNAYTVKTHHDVVGTNFSGPATSVKLNITATKDGAAYTISDGDVLSIDYPDNFTTDAKGKVKIENSNVVIANDAPEGVYKVVLSVKEGQQVKVAEYLFTVKDFNFDINPKVVYNNGSATTITCSQPASNDNVYSSALGTVNGNKVAVNSVTGGTTSTEGTYTITYTVWATGGDAAQATYTKDFEVRNTHSVSVSDTKIDRNAGTTSEGAYSTEPIKIYTKLNGSATTSSVLSNLSIVDSSKAATTEGNFKIEAVSDKNDEYTLTVKNNVTPGTYYVKFVQKVYNSASTASDKKDDVAEYAQFTVVE